MTPEESKPAYEVTFLDQADMDIEAAYVHLAPFVGEEKAETWARDLYLAGFRLADFPGPPAYPVDEMVSDLTGQEIRRMRFQGGTHQKPIGAVYRVYFYTVKAQSDAERSGIFILRVLHGATGPWPPAE